MSPGRICPHGELVPAGGSCPRCRDEENARYRRRGSSTARGYDARYKVLRRQVLAEEHDCWLCGQPARDGDPLTVDHVLPLALGRTNTRTNLRAAHRSCNSRRGPGGPGGAEESGSRETQPPGRRPL